MCTPDSTPDPKPQTAPADSVLAIAPAHVLDPYPDRVTSLGGVRQHTAPTEALTRKSPDQPLVSGRRRPFGASLLVTIAAQGLLAAAIATQRLSPVLGAAAAIGLLICGLALIVAEMIQVAGR